MTMLQVGVPTFVVSDAKCAVQVYPSAQAWTADSDTCEGSCTIESQQGFMSMRGHSYLYNLPNLACTA